MTIKEPSSPHVSPFNLKFRNNESLFCSKNILFLCEKRQFQSVWKWKHKSSLISTLFAKLFLFHLLLPRSHLWPFRLWTIRNPNQFKFEKRWNRLQTQHRFILERMKRQIVLVEKDKKNKFRWLTGKKNVCINWVDDIFQHFIHHRPTGCRCWIN